MTLLQVEPDVRFIHVDWGPWRLVDWVHSHHGGEDLCILCHSMDHMWVVEGGGWGIIQRPVCIRFVDAHPDGVPAELVFMSIPVILRSVQFWWLGFWRGCLYWALKSYWHQRHKESFDWCGRCMYLLDLGERRVAIILHPWFLECGNKCHRYFYGIHTWVWITGRI